MLQQVGESENALTVEKVGIFKETVKRYGKVLNPFHHQGIISG